MLLALNANRKNDSTKSNNIKVVYNQNRQSKKKMAEINDNTTHNKHVDVDIDNRPHEQRKKYPRPSRRLNHVFQYLHRYINTKAYDDNEILIKEKENVKLFEHACCCKTRKGRIQERWRQQDQTSHRENHTS